MPANSLKFYQKKSIIYISCAFYLLLFFGVIFYNSSFLYDQAFYYLSALETSNFNFFPVYGPQISGLENATFTPGGGLFLLYSIPLFFIKHPYSLGIFIGLISLVGILFFFQTLEKQNRETKKNITIVFFLTWIFWHNLFIEGIWNVNCYWFLSLIAFSLVIKSTKTKNRFILFLIGFLFSLILQVHLGGLCLILFLSIYFTIEKKYKINCFDFLIFFIGFIFSYFPYLIYELNHDWINTKNLMGVHHSALNLKNSLKGGIAPLIYTLQIEDFSSFKERSLPTIIAYTNLFLSIFIFLKNPLHKAVRYLLIISTILFLFFLLTKRAYYHHYVMSVIPLIIYFFSTLFFDGFHKFKKFFSFVILFYFSANIYLSVDRYVIRTSPHSFSSWYESASTELVVTPGDHNQLMNYIASVTRYKKTPKILIKESNSSCQITLGTPHLKNEYPLSLGTFYRCVKN